MVFGAGFGDVDGFGYWVDVGDWRFIGGSGEGWGD